RVASTAAVLLLMFGVAADAGLFFRADAGLFFRIAPDKTVSGEDGSEQSFSAWLRDYQRYARFLVLQRSLEKYSPGVSAPPGESEEPAAPPEWVGYTFGYASEKYPSLDLFIEWIKSGGTKVVNGLNYSEYSYNRPFLDWFKGREDLVLPTVKDNEFRFHGMNLIHDAVGFEVFYTTYRPGMEKPETSKTFSFYFMYLSEDQRKKAPPDITDMNFVKESLRKGEKECPWGEYWYVDYSEDENGKRTSQTFAFFLYGDCLVHILPKGPQIKDPWNPEYFNYFDFETVPLK
ncbi:MAG: hypothetical protein FWD39_06510, partial [Clostridiales bacterium]|nr:hypothetical protein [Clostridiales bacterium]